MELYTWKNLFFKYITCVYSGEKLSLEWVGVHWYYCFSLSFTVLIHFNYECLSPVWYYLGPLLTREAPKLLSRGSIGVHLLSTVHCVVDVVIETVIVLLVGFLGFSLGTMVSVIKGRQGYGNQTINESDTKVLEYRLSKIEERVKTLEDYILSSLEERERPERPLGPRERKADREEEEIVNLKILTLYKNGYSIRQIAREVGLSKSTVHKRLKKLLETTKT